MASEQPGLRGGQEGQVPPAQGVEGVGEEEEQLPHGELGPDLQQVASRGRAKRVRPD